MIFRKKLNRYGWIKQHGDIRDRQFKLDQPITLPDKVDLRPLFPDCYDQQSLGSCVLNALAGIYQYEHKRQNLPDEMFSRLFAYYNTRKLEGTINSDSGCSIRDAVKSANKSGICNENLWPYVINRFTKKPSCSAYKDAKNDKALQYEAVGQNLNDMKSCLASGFPIILGISVYQSFESAEVARTGIVPIPDKSEQFLGGHGLAVVGYNESNQWFIVRNSWNTSWGDNGNCYIPYSYLLNPNLCSDLWKVTLIGK